MPENFLLKWNDFQENVSKSFGILRNNTFFQDVTLVGDDQKQLSAHKVVLSSCSDYFNTILKQNNHSHPLLCFDGINSSDLNNLLDYIYNGEIQIYQEDLDRFLLIAQRFRLEGLLAAVSDNEAIVKDDEIVHETIEENVKGLGPSVKHNPCP